MTRNIIVIIGPLPLICTLFYKTIIVHVIPCERSEASREVANLTERKNPHPPVYGVKESVCLSVCLSVCYILSWTNTQHILCRGGEKGSHLEAHLILDLLKFKANSSQDKNDRSNFESVNRFASLSVQYN